MLVIFGACAVALFRLLRRGLRDEWLAALAAALATFTLPVGAFAFQLYPELPALLIVLCVSTWLLFHVGGTLPGARATAILAGAGAAALAWLHPRFLVVSIAFAAIGAWRTCGGVRRAFAGAYAVVLLSMLAFMYHVTGSWMPDALYRASAEEATVDLASIPSTLMAYGVNATWGLLPHSPWLLAALPGLVVLGREAPRHAAFVAGVVLALVVPASGHSLIAAGGTPGRFVLAVIPLLAWPAAALARRFWHSPAIRAAAACAIVLSLDAAYSYNRYHVKAYGPMRDASASGWKPNIAFPEIRSFGDPSQQGFALGVAIVGGVAALCALALVRTRAPRVDRPRARRSVATAALVVALLVGLSSAATASRGAWARREYLLDETRARRAAAEAMVQFANCRVCFSSTERQIDWRWLEPNPASTPAIDVTVEDGAVGVRVGLETDGAIRGFGRVRIDFGDGADTGWQGIVGAREASHRYEQAGRYRITVWVQVPDAQRMHVERVEISNPGKK
jgi:hypothetical protein